jgi:pSer/pThr/pTyr-binding forkhead associated (FHA) protein
MPFILTGQIKGQIVRYDLNNGEIHIGRDADNDIVLNHGTVSRYHAIIQVKEHRIRIKDLASSNGTYV